MVVAIALASQFGSIVEVEKDDAEVASSTTTEIIKEETDVVAEANRELERISAELDAEETRLLEERQQIDDRLEQIRQTRMSFQ